MNSTNFITLKYMGKNLSRKAVLNTSQSTGPSLMGLSYLHFSNHNWASYLSLYVASSTFSQRVTPKTSTTLNTSSRNPFGSSSTYLPWKVGGFILKKFWILDAGVLALGLVPLPRLGLETIWLEITSAWVIISWVKALRETLISALVISP